jgi:hypothetical protein
MSHLILKGDKKMEVWTLEIKDEPVTVWSDYAKAYEALVDWAGGEFEIEGSEDPIASGVYEFVLFCENTGSGLWATITRHTLDKN